MIVNQTKMRVTYADIDQMGVAYYARYFEFFEAGRAELLRELGLPYSKMESEGTRMPVIEAHCRYLQGARYDELITVKTFLKNVPKSTVRIDYEVFGESAGELLATGHTVHSFLNSKGRPTKPPGDFVRLIGDSLGISGEILESKEGGA